jgi:hypothetical protein
MRGFSITLACTSLAIASLTIASLASAGDRDLRKIDRKIAKEPAYTAKEPLYGLLVFGPQKQTRVWLVLDKSKQMTDHFDVVYADLNGNGDLTETAERFTGVKEGEDLRFRLGDFKDPASGAIHTDFKLRVSPGYMPTVMTGMNWRGGSRLGGGYPEIPNDGYLKFDAKPAFAPILWANGDGPFRFQSWCSPELTIGAADDFKVFIGQQGVGPSSFCAFQQHFLPDGEGVQATLIYQDVQGKELRTVHRLNDRC